jgi:hypothetical protein
VKAVPDLEPHLTALEELFAPAEPPKRSVHPSSTAVVLYGFGDASGHGFGSTLLKDLELSYRHGQRCHFIQEEESSNYRELANLVFALEEAATKGHLDQNEIFMLTDNSTAEAAFSKGTTGNRKLFHLLLRP